jgi:hypothetical protein
MSILGRGDGPSRDAPLRQLHAVEGEGRDGSLDVPERRSEVHEGAEDHVPRGAGRGVDPEDALRRSHAAALKERGQDLAGGSRQHLARERRERRSARG